LKIKKSHAILSDKFEATNMEDAVETTLRKVTPLRRSGQEKRAKFVEIAQRRTNSAIKAIRVIGKLGNKSAYDYTEEDVKKIAGALSKEIEALRARMLTRGSKDVVDFKL
jgi:hypothetical protein